ncbi:unnamed protein product [Ixodes hexagonus]
MNVARAIRVLSPDVTAALEHLKDQAGHTCNISVTNAGPTIIFIKNFYCWFVLHDTSNRIQHFRLEFPDTRHYDDVEDGQLEWVEATLPIYLEDLKKSCAHASRIHDQGNVRGISPHHVLHRGLHQAPAVEEKLLFVLTRKFNSDPIESLFGTLRMSFGCNGVLDVRAALAGLERVLKTGIATSSEGSNVAHSESAAAPRPLPAEAPTSSPQPKLPKSQLGRAALTLRRFTATVLPHHLPALQISVAVYVGGYVARVIGEQMKCDNCVAISTKPATN